jgi:hypothetical protein
MGVIISGNETEESYDLTLTQLINRGDRRLQDMLIGMAEAGIRRYTYFDRRAKEFADMWISEHDIPGYDEWFAAKDRDEVLPWDFIDVGVTKKWLVREWERALREEITPNCRQMCSGCGERSYGGGVCFEEKSMDAGKADYSGMR